MDSTITYKQEMPEHITSMLGQQTLSLPWLHHKRVRVRAGAERRAAAQRGRAGRHGLAPHLGRAQAAGAQQHALRAQALPRRHGRGRRRGHVCTQPGFQSTRTLPSVRLRITEESPTGACWNGRAHCSLSCKQAGQEHTARIQRGARCAPRRAPHAADGVPRRRRAGRRTRAGRRQRPRHRAAHARRSLSRRHCRFRWQRRHLSHDRPHRAQ